MLPTVPSGIAGSDGLSVLPAIILDMLFFFFLTVVRLFVIIYVQLLQAHIIQYYFKASIILIYYLYDRLINVEASTGLGLKCLIFCLYFFDL